jgi:3-deoxy-7-phosphoheptulonate synthase
VDGPQALLLKELGWFLEDVAVARECYEKRRALARQHAASS